MKQNKMTKEQLSNLSDDVRIPTEILLDRVKGFETYRKVAVSEEGGIAFFFSDERIDGLTITADIEIYADGTVSASVIPYRAGPDGLELFQSEDEPIELWDVEEEPPYEESIRLIHDRLGRPLLSA